MTRDPVTPELRRSVLERDGGCVAQLLGYVHQCADQWGDVHLETALDRMQLDHVKDEPRMGRRAPSDMLHLVTVCAVAHERWATGHRSLLRVYLRRMEARATDGEHAFSRANSPAWVAASVMRDAGEGIL